MNEFDKDSIINVNENGLVVTSNGDKQWGGGRCTHGIKELIKDSYSKGMYYYEATIEGTGICRVGWSTMAAHHELGKDAHGFGYGGTGMKSVNGTFEKYGTSFGNGDTVGCYLNWDDLTIKYSVNNNILETAFIIPDSFRGTVLFPAFVIKGCGIKVTFNFGAEPFKYMNRGAGILSINNADPSCIISSLSKDAFITSGKRTPLAIILEPSRDLAEQVYNDIEGMMKYVVDPNLRLSLLVGGDDTKYQKKMLARGCDIVVGTLGRVSDLVKTNLLDLSQVRLFILDEADKMIDKDNLQQVMTLYDKCPAGGSGDNRLQVCFFSATLHSAEITNLASKICYNPSWVDLKGVDSVPESVHHVVYKIDLNRDNHLIKKCSTKSITDAVHIDKLSPTEQASQDIKEIKLQILLGIIDKFEMSQCIIFCRTNVDCDNLETFLCNHGKGSKFIEKKESGKEHKYSCCVLGGMRTIQERRRNLEAFKEGDVRFLICTDVAARGIDIKNLPYCINLTLPDETENYIHRIGRVGRADCMGLAISIVSADNIKEQVWYHANCKNRGKGCTNRKLLAENGCTTWYDETLLLDLVEKRLKQPISSMTSDYELPEDIKSLGIEYGEINNQGDDVISDNIKSLQPVVKELAQLENMASNQFLLMQTLF